MKIIPVITLLSALAMPVVADAIEVEFQVPVELRNIDGNATHVSVTCGSFGAGRFLNSSKTETALSGEFSKSFSGVVTVVVAWPGATIPTGTYRCTMAMRTTTSFMDFAARPAAVNTRVVTTVDGDFSAISMSSSGKKVIDTKLQTAPRAPSMPPPR